MQGVFYVLISAGTRLSEFHKEFLLLLKMGFILPLYQLILTQNYCSVVPCLFHHLQTPAVMDLSPVSDLACMAWGGAPGQWEPTLAVLFLRQRPGTDGASLGWDPGQGRVPAMNSP